MINEVSDPVSHVSPNPAAAPPNVPDLGRRAFVPLTLGLWTFSFATFAGCLAASTQGRMPPWLWAWLGVITLSGLVVSLGLYVLTRRLPTTSLRSRWTVLMIAVLFSAIAQSALDGYIAGAVHLAFGVAGGKYFHLADFTLNSMIYAGLFGFYVATVEMLGVLSRAVALERMNARYAVAAAEARELARDSQLQMLRFQLNPHFLFNTLNGISSLVVSGQPEQAEEMLQRLCSFLRATLSKIDDNLVPLDHELTAAEAYLDIEAARFSNTLDIAIDCGPDLGDVLVPTLILQPLVENAVKYALAPASGAGTLSLQVRDCEGRLTIDVVDNGAGHPSPVPGTGVGLENIRQRLAAVYGSAAELWTERSSNGFHARITLPIVRLELAAARP